VPPPGIAAPAGTSGAPLNASGVLDTSDADGNPAANAAGTPGPAAADEASAVANALKLLLPEMQKDVQEKYDYSIPESPGFTIIGMTPEDVVHPRTLRDFAVALKDGVDESGRFKTGIALDFTPFQWFMRDQTMGEYLRLDTATSTWSVCRLLPGKSPAGSISTATCWRTPLSRSAPHRGPETETIRSISASDCTCRSSIIRTDVSAPTSVSARRCSRS
jgi:hypothetical protein